MVAMDQGKKYSVNSKLSRDRGNKFSTRCSNKKSSVGACKSYCMNFDSF